MDRRTFFKGSLVAATSAVAFGGLAACAPNEQSQADTKDNNSNGGSGEEAWYGSPLDVATLDIAETVETDLLICGAGAGGIVATAIAAEKGAEVLCIEKGASYGDIKSNIGIVGARGDAETGVSVSKTAILNEHTRYANGWCDPQVTKVWLEESGETFDWIADTVAEFGATPFYETDDGGGSHGCWPVMPIEHGFNYQYSEEVMKAVEEKVEGNPDPAAMMQALPGISDYLMEKAEAWGANIRYNTSLLQLIQDDSGRVTGVIAEADKKYVQINAAKGVILATGGYEADPDLLKLLNEEGVAVGGVSMTQMGCNGDGIKAGIWAGGVKDPIPTLMTFARAAIAPEESLGYPYMGATCWMGDQPFLKVNMRGERVCCESSPYDYPLHVAAQQPENKIASIWDANYQEHIKAFHTIGCSRIIPSETVSPNGIPTGLGLTLEGNDAMIFGAIEAGIIQQADTIEELAEKLLIPAKDLKATIERYNELSAQGEDTDFGKPAKDLLPLSSPPYFGSYFGGHVLCTLDGLKIDKDMRVINAEKEPIEGLYAVGNCSGSMYAATYPELFIGNANGRTITHARHAVIHALEK